MFLNSMRYKFLLFTVAEEGNKGQICYSDTNHKYWFKAILQVLIYKALYD